jgi:hypothetical protein
LCFLEHTRAQIDCHTVDRSLAHLARIATAAILQSCPDVAAIAPAR